MNEIILTAHAKINLTLDVTGKRANGYHDVRTVMQHLKLCDRVTVRKETEPGFRLSVGETGLPVDDSNLMVKAAKLLFEAFDLPGGVSMELEKNIPIAAGLAGGSADAAAVLKGINELYGLGKTTEELQAFGVKIGADVPFCLTEQPALAEGIGEVLTPVSGCPACTVILAKPQAAVSTKDVYQALDALPAFRHPDTEGMLDALERQDLSAVAARLENVLEPVTEKQHPVIREIERLLLEKGALNARMSGSGPTVFALFDSPVQAEEAADALRFSGFAQEVLITAPA